MTVARFIFNFVGNDRLITVRAYCDDGLDTCAIAAAAQEAATADAGAMVRLVSLRAMFCRRAAA